MNGSDNNTFYSCFCYKAIFVNLYVLDYVKICYFRIKYFELKYFTLKMKILCIKYKSCTMKFWWTEWERYKTGRARSAAAAAAAGEKKKLPDLMHHPGNHVKRLKSITPAMLRDQQQGLAKPYRCWNTDGRSFSCDFSVHFHRQWGVHLHSAVWDEPSCDCRAQTAQWDQIYQGGSFFTPFP